MPKTKDSKPKDTAVCVLCKSDEDDELRFGKFYHSKDLSVHNFCMLFASDLSQNGKNDDDGFAGFLPKDIKKEVVRGRRLKCSYCKTNGATIGCCVPACKKVFHLKCGQKHKSLHLFFDSFLSYCSAHKSKPVYPEDEPLTREFSCSICCDTVCLRDYETTVWSSCCKNGWFHKPCIQRQALSAGYFFRCPLCNNTEQFQKQMLHHGIYIPQQDASWELEENAFQELLFRHEQCDATRCLCPKGRKHHTKTSQWRLVLCEDCGSQGRHIGCDDSVTPKGSWICQSCVEITKKMEAKKQNECSDKVKKVKPNSKPHMSQGSNNGRTLRSSSRISSAESTSEGEIHPTPAELPVIKAEIPGATSSTCKIRSPCIVRKTSVESTSFKDESRPTSEKLPHVKYEIRSASEQKRDSASSTALHGGATSFNTKSTYRIKSPYAQHSASEKISSFKDEISPISEELCLIKNETSAVSEQKSGRANYAMLHGGATSFSAESSYKITKISKRGEEDLSKFTGSSGLLGVQSETKEPLGIISSEPKDYAESSDLEQETVIDLFSDVVATDSDSSPYKSEIFSQGSTDELHEIPASNLRFISLNGSKEENYISMANSLHLLLDNRSVNLEPAVSKIPSVKNELYYLPADSSLTEDEDNNVTKLSDNLNCGTFLSQNTTPVDISCKENIAERESDEMATGRDSLSNLSFSPDKLKKTYKMHRKHSKGACGDMEDKLPKKQKLNGSSGQSDNSVMTLNLVQDVEKNTGPERKYSVKQSDKTVNEISSPPPSSGSVVHFSQKRSEASDAENILGNRHTPVVPKVLDGLGYGSERRQREPFVKVITVHNRLAKKTLRTGRAAGNCEISRNSTECSNGHLTSENRPVKKQKLNVLSKKNYGTTLRCKDNYRCIKALLGGPCRCCEDKSKLTKESGTKNKSKKCTQNCRAQYNIECFGKRSEVSLGSKHSCNRPTNYIVNFWHPGKQISTVTETKEKLSVKPQVIHLKTMPH